MERLSLIVALLLVSGASAEKTVTCGAHVHRLSCDSGVISVDKALWGRSDHTTCAAGKEQDEVANDHCHAPDALTVLKERCNGKKWCELNGNVFTTDPCTETFKYMETSFSCVPAIHRIACEHSMANLHCGAGEVIKVLGADLGRRDHTTCAFRREPARLEKIDCTRHTAVLAQKCDGKNQCTVRASQSVLGTSCMDTSLYLEYAFTCSAAK